MAREKITALKKIIIPSSDGSGATTSEVVGTEGAGIALPWIQPPQNPFIDGDLHASFSKCPFRLNQTYLFRPKNGSTGEESGRSTT